MVSRRAGIGTIVKSDHVAQRYMQVGDAVSDLRQYAQDIILCVKETSDIEADEPTAELLGCPQGQVMVEIAWIARAGRRHLAYIIN